jgi:hypothetical protein
LILNRKRFSQWLLVAFIEGQRKSAIDKIRLLGTMLWAALTVQVAPHEWRRRIRVCRKCPIYDRSIKRCRPSNDSDLGCGCYVPFMAAHKKTCWADDNTESHGWSRR